MEATRRRVVANLLGEFESDWEIAFRTIPPRRLLASSDRQEDALDDT